MRSLLEGGLFGSLDTIFESTSRMSAGNNTQLDITAINTPFPDTAYALSVTGRIFACRYEITLQNLLPAPSTMMGVRWSTGTPTGFFSKVRTATSQVGIPMVGFSNNRAAMPTLAAGPAYVTDNPSANGTSGFNLRLNAVIAFPSSLTVTLTPLMQSTSDMYSLIPRTFDVRVVG